jgi:hypothetical protein
MLVGESLMGAIVAVPSAAALLNGTHPIVILTGQDPPYHMTAPAAPPAWGASYLIRFTSEADMQAVFAAGGIPSFVGWIMYDNEPATEPPTPPSELPPNDPGPFYAAAAQLAHANGKSFAATAGFSGTAKDTQDVYDTATGWDLFAIQNQTGENDVATYDRAIVDQTARAWAVNPAVAFSSGIGDYAGGGLVLTPETDAAMVTIPSNGLVWLNFGPHPGLPERDDLAIDAIETTAGMPRAAPLVP